MRPRRLDFHLGSNLREEVPGEIHEADWPVRRGQCAAHRFGSNGGILVIAPVDQVEGIRRPIRGSVQLLDIGLAGGGDLHDLDAATAP